MDKETLERRKKLLSDLILKNTNYVPMKIKDIAILLQIPREQREDLQQTLDALVQNGVIGISKKGKYGRPEREALYGIFTSNRRGFGFVTVEDMEEDIFIPQDAVNGAFHQDKVKVVITREKSGNKRYEGKITGIVEHQITQLVGTYQNSRNFGFVIPDKDNICYDIYIPKSKNGGAVNGQKVVLTLTSYGENSRNPEGCITEILGDADAPGTDILSIVRAYDIPSEFPEDVKASVKDVPDTVPEKAKAGRVDLRALQTVTIDGADAKDLDDAISLLKEGNIYHLGVHIADVSEYVTEKSALDKEAYRRSTSVYLVDRVIPMLPKELSNGLCSLNQGEDRLTLSCLMDIDAHGAITGHRICETVIRSDRRMTYDAVRKIVLEEDPSVTETYQELVPLFFCMKELAEILHQKREKRGAIDFDFPESHIILDEKGHPVQIEPHERDVATGMIEEFMLAANETVAEDYFWQEIPFLYRCHGKPDSEKIQELNTFIGNFGYMIRQKDQDIHPKELQKLLSKIKDSDEENLISRLTLRSMKRAEYSPECIGHFGLAAKYYCHFTSPIRRYPDLQIHRIIKENLHHQLNEKRKEHYRHILTEVGKHTSEMERRADDAERETDKLKMTEYMADRLGEQYDGIISGITSWGIYVELPNTVEGMVSVNSLRDGHYQFDEQRYEMVRETGGKSYHMGQPVQIRVVAADVAMRTIDFEFLADAHDTDTNDAGTNDTTEKKHSHKNMQPMEGRKKAHSYSARKGNGQKQNGNRDEQKRKINRKGQEKHGRKGSSRPHSGE